MDIRSLPQEHQIHAVQGGLGRVRVMLCQRTDVSLQHLPAMLLWVEKHHKVRQALGKQWQSLSPSKCDVSIIQTALPCTSLVFSTP